MLLRANRNPRLTTLILTILAATFVATATLAAQDPTQRSDTVSAPGAGPGFVLQPADTDSVAAWRPMTLHEKTTFYQRRTFSLRAVLRAAAAAGIAQWRDRPEEWGAGMGGYGLRAAAAYGGSAVHHSVEFGIGALLHEDPRFERSSRIGFSARAADAVRNTAFVRTDDGGRSFAWSRAAAALVTGFAVNSWEPRRIRSTHHALALSLAGALSYATSQVAREFTPDVKRFLFH